MPRKCYRSARELSEEDELIKGSGKDTLEWNPKDRYRCHSCGKSVGIYGYGNRDLYPLGYRLRTHYTLYTT